MKKIVLLVFAAIVAISCNKLDENEYLISGTVAGLKDGSKVILEMQDEIGQGLKATDTAIIKDGKFEFKGTVTEPELRFVQVDSLQGKVIFILENGEINMTVYKDSLNKSVTKGTFNNDQFAAYNVEQMKIQKKIADYRNDNKEKMETAMQSNDTVSVNSLRDGFMKLKEEENAFNLTYAEKNPKAFISVLMLENYFYQPTTDFEQIKKIYNGLDKTVKDTKPGKKLGELIGNFSSAEVGKKAPEFSGPNPEGKTVSLTESLGKVTIIDFWAAWCGPCRKENPNVVALYNEFHDKGLNIIGVSLDKEGDAERWKEAITADKLTWPQVSNLKYWNDPIALKYNVKSIPATFILDANGTIVAKDLRGEELKAKVIELLGS